MSEETPTNILAGHGSRPLGRDPSAPYPTAAAMLAEALKPIRSAGFDAGIPTDNSAAVFKLSKFCDWCLSERLKPTDRQAVLGHLLAFDELKMYSEGREAFFALLNTAARNAGKPEPVPGRVHDGRGYRDDMENSFEDRMRVRLGLPTKAEAARQGELAALRDRIAELETENADLKAQLERRAAA